MIREALFSWFLRPFSCACLALLAACGGSKIESGPYRAVLALPGGELPFGLELTQENGKTVAYLINGSERVRVPNVDVKRRRLYMAMPAYGNHLSAKVGRDGLAGELVMVTHGGKEQGIRFTATPGATHRFFATPASDNADISGRWSVTFTGPDHRRYQGIGEFEQTFDRVTGTFLTPTGDHGFLAGEMRGDELHLSSFDGGHAYLYGAHLQEDGTLAGTFWSGLAPPQAFVARRDATAQLADPTVVTTIRDDVWTLGFTFSDEAGNAVSLADPRFSRKVILITFAGSWSSNCHDQAAFLAPLYAEYRKRGLEIVALMFEHSGEFEAAARAVRALRARFGIEYPTLIAGISDNRSAAEKFPQLSGIHAFPTTLFVDRRGRVRLIYTGFSGPATGEHYEDLKRSFVAQIDTLLAEDSTRVSQQRPLPMNEKK